MLESQFHRAAKRMFFVLAAVWSHAGFSIGGEPDVLERPALISPHASGSVLLAMTRAGKRLLAVGERGIVLFSDDDAVSWQQAQVPVSVSLTNVRFVTDKKGWAVGHSGVVLHTEDGGATWVKQLDGRQAAKVVLQAAEKAAATRNDAETRRQLDDAQRLLADGPDKPFFDVYFSDESHGFIVGAYGLFFMTQDGGKTWLPWQNHIDNPNGRHLYCINAIGSSLYIAGEEGTLYRSGDAGRSFIEVTTPYRGSYFGVIPLSGNKVIVYGLRGNAYWSDDGGGHWRKSETDTQATLTAGLALTDGSVVVVSQGGEVLRSTDDGRSFQVLPVVHRFPFSGVVQARNDNLILSGNRGITGIAVKR
jgi:photosystem II stability/assembly factor-like uncharacterized protein